MSSSVVIARAVHPLLSVPATDRNSPVAGHCKIAKGPVLRILQVSDQMIRQNGLLRSPP